MKEIKEKNRKWRRNNIRVLKGFEEIFSIIIFKIVLYLYIVL